MIRLVQRKLIIPRGDTGSFSVPTIAAASQGDVAVFTIFDCLTRAKVFQKTVTPQDSNLVVEFTHNDTVNLPPGRYVWDIKFYINPQYADNELVNGDEINSYYAGYSLPDCEIRETGDDLLTSDDSPATTLTPESLNILSATLTETVNARNEVVASVENAISSATVATNKANEASASATSAATSATNASESAASASESATNASEYANAAASSASAATTSASAASSSANAANQDANAALSAKTDAETAATMAAASATEASGYAGQIIGLSVNAQTLNASSAATAAYDSGTGILEIGVPKGTTYTPSVAADGTISWTNDGSQSNPPSINIRGPQGAKGDPFAIKKTFASIVEMENYSGSDVVEGDFVVISSTIDDPDNAKLYLKAANGYTFITDLSGAEGIKGDTGNGIQSIAKTNTSGLQDTYTITYTNGQTFNFVVVNGETGPIGSEYTVLIQSTQPTEPTNKLWINNQYTNVQQVPTVEEMNAAITAYSPSASVVKNGNIATISITDKSGTTSTTISDGISGTNGQDGISPVLSVIDITNGHRVTIVDANGTKTFDVINGAKGDQGDDYVLTAQDKVDIADLIRPATVSVSGTTPTITCEADTRYICGTVSTLSITPSQSGICDVVFTSGTSPTVLTIPNTVNWPEWFDPTNLSANVTYELNILDGVYGMVMAWA